MKSKTSRGHKEYGKNVSKCIKLLRRAIDAGWDGSLISFEVSEARFRKCKEKLNDARYATGSDIFALWAHPHFLSNWLMERGTIQYFDSTSLDINALGERLERHLLIHTAKLFAELDWIHIDAYADLLVRWADEFEALEEAAE
jgi:hypothetical protein